MPNPARKKFGLRDDYKVGDYVVMFGMGMFGAYKLYRVGPNSHGNIIYGGIAANGLRLHRWADDLRIATSTEIAAYPVAQKDHADRKADRKSKRASVAAETIASKARVDSILAKYGVPLSSPMWQELVDNPLGFTAFMNDEIHAMKPSQNAKG